MLEDRAGVDLWEYRVFGHLLPRPPNLKQMRNYSMSKKFMGEISLEPVSQCTWSVQYLEPLSLKSYIWPR